MLFILSLLCFFNIEYTFLHLLQHELIEVLLFFLNMDNLLIK